ncbi:mycothiol transferase [Streptomyces sp. NBC_01803]|uniref:mycothiol transferase n=1 Tax=Streptomyces sp. NBC_01803 TaxID=2975946 RepID=UPI003FA36DF2
MVAEAWTTWRAEVLSADRFTAETPDLGFTVPHQGNPLSLRAILVHMIEEYARHDGHADLLRERIDGRVGQ